MSDRNYKDFAVAYSIFNMMELGKPVKTNFFAKSLNIGFHVAKRVISNMSKNNIIKAQRGFTSRGIEKIDGVTIEEVFKLYNIEFKPYEEIKASIESAVASSTYRPKFCDICEVELSLPVHSDLCKDCQKETDLPPPSMIARCGHPSYDRYFKCRTCLPALPEDDVFVEAEINFN